MRLYQQGFTLTEALLTVLIIGILVSVALPSYFDSVLKARRAEGKALAMEVAARQERFFLQRNTYTTQMGSAGLGYPDDMTRSNGRFYFTESGYYKASTLPCDEGTIATCFEVNIRAQGAQLEEDSNCTTFIVDHLGERSVFSVLGSESHLDLCW